MKRVAKLIVIASVIAAGISIPAIASNQVCTSICSVDWRGNESCIVICDPR